MKEIKDYLHLYLGCDVVVHDDDPKKRLVRTFFGFADPTKTSIYIYDRLAREGRTIVTFIKLILRPLSDMTEEEAIEVSKIIFKESFPDKIRKDDKSFAIDFGKRQIKEMKNISHNGETWCNIINYCRKIGIDCDALIESGLAIDKTKL